MTGFRVHGGGSGGGGGGGTGNLEVGPSFGQSAGDDDSTLGASTTIFLEPYGLIFDLYALAALDLTTVNFHSNSLGSAVSIDLTQLGLIYNQLAATASIDLQSLAFSGDLAAQADISLTRLALTNSQLAAAVAIDLETLGLIYNQLAVSAAVDLQSLSGTAALAAQVAISGSLATTRALGVQAAIDLNSLSARADLNILVNLDAHARIEGAALGAFGAIDLSTLAASSALGIDAAVFLSEMELIDYLDWADANVTTTGFTSPANAIDKSLDPPASACTAAASGIGGLTANTTNGTLVSSFPNFASPFTDFTITSVILEYRWSTVTAGTQLSAGLVTMQGAYSTNDGSSFTNTELVSQAGNASSANPETIDITTPIGGDWTKITQFRHRWTGTVASGTGLSKTMAFNAFGYRLRIQATRTF